MAKDAHVGETIVVSATELDEWVCTVTVQAGDPDAIVALDTEDLSLVLAPRGFDPRERALLAALWQAASDLVFDFHEFAEVREWEDDLNAEGVFLRGHGFDRALTGAALLRDAILSKHCGEYAKRRVGLLERDEQPIAYPQGPLSAMAVLEAANALPRHWQFHYLGTGEDGNDCKFGLSAATKPEDHAVLASRCDGRFYRALCMVEAEALSDHHRRIRVAYDLALVLNAVRLVDAARALRTKGLHDCAEDIIAVLEDVRANARSIAAALRDLIFARLAA